ncbi:MAG: hypothetical protein KDJ50_03775 [Alphaproteobacteria bacterium]|nr:hypothetical protein [Alphaproteobacteria bacterium]
MSYQFSDFDNLLMYFRQQQADINTSPEYSKVLEAVRGGDLIIDVLLAPPRTGSTATALQIANSLLYDGCFLEPEVWLGEDESRLVQTCKQIDTIYEELRENRKSTNPIRILLKVMTDQYGAMQDLQSLMNLAHKFVLMVRDPVRSFESTLLYRSKILDALGTAPTTITGLMEKGYVDWGANLSFLSQAPQDGKTIWQQIIDHMEVTRDYRFLGPQMLQDTYGLNRQGQFQKNIFSWLAWQSPKLHHPAAYDISYLDYLPKLDPKVSRLGQWQKAVEDGLLLWEKSGNAKVDIKDLPRPLQILFEGWHFGWNSLVVFQFAMASKLQDEIYDLPHPPFLIFDFDVFAQEQERVLKALSEFYGAVMRTDDQRPVIMDRYGETENSKKIASLAFGRVKGTSAILPDLRPIIPLDHFPEFSKLHLKHALMAYGELMSIQRLQEFRKRSPELLGPCGLTYHFRKATDPVAQLARLRAENLILGACFVSAYQKLYLYQGQWLKQYRELFKIPCIALKAYFFISQQRYVKERHTQHEQYFKDVDTESPAPISFPLSGGFPLIDELNEEAPFSP